MALDELFSICAARRQDSNAVTAVPAELGPRPPALSRGFTYEHFVTARFFENITHNISQKAAVPPLALSNFGVFHLPWNSKPYMYCTASHLGRFSVGRTVH